MVFKIKRIIHVITKGHLTVYLELKELNPEDSLTLRGQEKGAEKEQPGR